MVYKEWFLFIPLLVLICIISLKIGKNNIVRYEKKAFRVMCFCSALFAIAVLLLSVTPIFDKSTIGPLQTLLYIASGALLVCALTCVKRAFSLKQSTAIFYAYFVISLILVALQTLWLMLMLLHIFNVDIYLLMGPSVGAIIGCLYGNHAMQMNDEEKTYGFY